MEIRNAALKVALSKYKIVSFDIFDTLIKRDAANPQAVFAWVERRYQTVYGEDVSGFREKRIKAEHKAEMVCQRNEISFDEIYECLEGYSRQQKERLAKLEIDTELKMIVPNIQMQKLYQWCKEKGKRIFLISDMYLPRQIIEKFLKNTGYTGYEELYLSSEQDAKKKDGLLYKRFLEQEHIRPRQVLHIGNSKRLDVLGAAKAGIPAFWVPTYENHLLYQEGAAKAECLQGQYLRCFLNNRIQKKSVRAWQIGYEVMGPIVLQFLKWLQNRTEGSDKILFLSRDMYVFYHAYKRLYGETGKSCTYVYISRQSLLPAVLYYSDAYYTVIRQWTSGKRTLSYLFDILGIKVENYLDFLSRYGFQKDQIIDLEQQGEDASLWKVFAALKDDIKRANEEQALKVLEYVRPFFQKASVAVVDLGWHSTIQIYLQLILEGARIPYKAIRGYYVGTNGPFTTFPVQEEGFLFERNRMRYKLDSGIFLMECFCLELTGTVTGYLVSEGKGIPVLEKCEQGNPRYIKWLQKGMLDFVKDISEFPFWKYGDVSLEQVFLSYRNLLNCPDRMECRQLRSVSYYEKKPYHMIANRSRLFYVFHPRYMLTDLLDARWKAGFLKELFGIRLRYHDMYYGVLRWKDKLAGLNR